MNKLKVAYGSGAICGGCCTAILDVHEKILDVIDRFDFVYCQMLCDQKDFDHADVGFWEGTIRTKTHEEELKSLREKVDTLISFGTCACYGGLPGLSFYYTMEAMLSKIYIKTRSTVEGKIPSSEEVPELERGLLPADQLVEVDYYIPGCPPPPETIANFLLAVSEGKKPEVEHKTCCSECSRRMTTPAEMVRRKVGAFDESLVVEDRQKCFLSQGILCTGSVTLNRCGAACQENGFPCMGCSGPSLEVLREYERDPLRMVVKRLALLSGEEPEKVVTEREFKIVEEQLYDLTHQFYAFLSTHPVMWRRRSSKITELLKFEGE